MRGSVGLLSLLRCVIDRERTDRDDEAGDEGDVLLWGADEEVGGGGDEGGEEGVEEDGVSGVEVVAEKVHMFVRA